MNGYVVAAYVVVLVALLAYVAIIAAKLARMDRDLEELTELARRKGANDAPPATKSIPVDRPPARLDAQRSG